MEAYEQFRIIYNEKKTAIQAEIETEHYQLGLLQEELHILERKRKSKYKQDHIANKELWIKRKENDIEHCDYKLYKLECENHYEMEKLRNSGEAVFEVVANENAEPYMTYYKITKKEVLPIV